MGRLARLAELIDARVARFRSHPAGLLLSLAWTVVLVIGVVELRVDEDSVHPALWFVLIVSAVLYLARRLLHFVVEFPKPNRAPIDWWDHGWIAILLLTLLPIGFGLFGVLDSNTDADGGFSAGLLVIGLVAAALLVRHVRKPVDAERARGSAHFDPFR